LIMPELFEASGEGEGAIAVERVDGVDDFGGRVVDGKTVTVIVIAHGPDNVMNLLGCVGVSAVQQ
jgi:hypothetical protein